MREVFDCPICLERCWEEIQRFTYRIADHEKAARPVTVAWRRVIDYSRIVIFNGPMPPQIAVTALTAKERRSRRVLFEVWCPGRETVELVSLMCAKCGFMTYTPRPSAVDLKEKYAFYAKNGWNIGGQKGYSALAMRFDSRRAERIFQATTGARKERCLSILDYGGGNGKLLLPFLASGHDCCLVDYNDDLLPGIHKLADEIEGIPEGMEFDIILASHVLEHVPDPLALVAGLGEHMAAGGRLYVEVPMEIWGGIRIGPDPVTHINYFNPASLAGLLRNAGLEPIQQRSMYERYGASSLLVHWVLAAKGRDRSEEETGRRHVLPGRVLKPGRLYSLGRIFRSIVWPRIADPFLRLQSRLPARWLAAGRSPPARRRAPARARRRHERG